MTRRRRKRVDWTYVNSRTSEAECRRCGERERLPIPCPITAFVTWIRYFNEKHQHCEEPTDG